MIACTLKLKITLKEQNLSPDLHICTIWAPFQPHTGVESSHVEAGVKFLQLTGTWKQEQQHYQGDKKLHHNCNNILPFSHVNVQELFLEMFVFSFESLNFYINHTKGKETVIIFNLFNHRRSYWPNRICRCYTLTFCPVGNASQLPSNYHCLCQ